ncbi:MAG: hypothetical protein IPK97_20735 [Ahniella sp.]|nr:hypothetical protein [Ahniella sp.]
MKHSTLLVSILAVGLSPIANANTLFSSALDTRGIPAGGQYVPPGGLYDNEQSNGSTSLASQDSSGTLTARTADDFQLPAQGCATNQFQITQIRIHGVQSDAAVQPFAVDIYNDNGAGTAPTPAGAITPIFTVQQSDSTLFGAFGAGTSVSEVTFAPTNMILTGGTTYWLSAYGTNATANAAGFNNFFAVSNGATGTTDNGVIIAPGAGVATWTAAEAVIGGNPLAFSFAVDGVCIAENTPVPANNPWGLVALVGLLTLAGGFFVQRRMA